MLSEIDKVLKRKHGFASVQYNSILSPTFLYLHFIDEYMKNGNNVLYVSIHTSMDYLKIICGKMAIRLDQQKFTFYPLKSIITESLEINPSTSNQLYMELTERIKPDEKTLVIIDDLESLNSFLEPYSEIQFLMRLRKNLSSKSLIIVAYTEWQPIYRNIFHISFRLSPIGTGFGKNLTGELEIEQLNMFVDSAAETTRFHYFVGDRNVKLYTPGSAQLLM